MMISITKLNKVEKNGVVHPHVVQNCMYCSFLKHKIIYFFNETLVLISFDTFEPMKFVLASQANMVELVFTICDPGPQTQS